MSSFERAKFEIQNIRSTSMKFKKLLKTFLKGEKSF